MIVVRSLDRCYLKFISFKLVKMTCLTVPTFDILVQRTNGQCNIGCALYCGSRVVGFKNQIIRATNVRW